MQIRISYLATVLASLLLLLIGHQIAVEGLEFFFSDDQEHVRARVIEITGRLQPEDMLFHFDDDDDFYIDDILLSLIGETIVFNAEITSGNRRGQIVRSEQNLRDYIHFTLEEVKEGQTVLLINTGMGWHFSGIIRTDRIIILGLLFIAALLFFGRKKGFNTILSLAFTCLAVFTVFIPSILSGKNIFLMAALVCVFTTVVTLVLVMGYNKKSLAAAIGCISGLLAAGLITLIMDRVLLLTGVLNEQSLQLVYLPLSNPIDLKAIIFAGIVIGAMGAIMDVSMSISSSLWEIKEEAKTIKFKALFRSGLNIGKDIMGSMANTLILAYIGSSLSVILVLIVISNSLMQLLNMEMIIVEILQALSGSFGILLAMPLTAFFAAVFFTGKKKK